MKWRGDDVFYTAHKPAALAAGKKQQTTKSSVDKPQKTEK